MNLSHIRIFVAVVEAGSFTKAAAILDITQSGVSHAVSSLETTLQTTLLIRDRNGISLTESGEKIFLHCQEILRHINHISEEAHKFSNLEKGKLRIGSLPSASVTLLPKVLASFQRKYPNVEIVLFEGNDEEIIEWLNTSTIDLAITTHQDDKFDIIPISRDLFHAVLSPKHPLADAKKLNIIDIKTEAFIMPKGGCQPLIINAFAKLGVAPNIQYNVQDMNTVFAMVQEQLGWTIVPKKSIPSTLTDVVSIPIYPPIWRDIGLAVHSIENSQELAISFIEEVKKYYN